VADAVVDRGARGKGNSYSQKKKKKKKKKKSEIFSVEKSSKMIKNDQKSSDNQKIMTFL